MELQFKNLKDTTLYKNILNMTIFNTNNVEVKLNFIYCCINHLSII